LIRALDLRGPGKNPFQLVLRNPSAAELSESLRGDFRPGVRLSLLSVPIEIPADEARDVWRWILAQCPDLAAPRLPQIFDQRALYVFIGSRVPLTVLERRYHYQTRRYRATDKFTGGLNRKLLKVDQKTVAIREAPTVPSDKH